MIRAPSLWKGLTQDVTLGELDIIRGERPLALEHVPGKASSGERGTPSRVGRDWGSVQPPGAY